MKTMLTLAAVAMLAAGLFAQECECADGACQAQPAPAAQEAAKKAPDGRKGPRRPAPMAGAKPAPKEGQGPRGPRMRPDRPGAPDAKATPAERAAALRARAAELEKRAAALEAEKAPAAPEEK